MNRILSDEEFHLRFNFQKLLRIDIDDDDYERISKALNIQLEYTKKTLEAYTKKNMSIAAKLEKKTDTLSKVNKMIKKKVMFIGDSITSDRLSFFNIIRILFNDYKGIEFIDAAVSCGKTPELVDEFYGRVLNHNPEVVSIMIGTNDFRRNNNEYGKNTVEPDGYEKNLEYIFMMLSEKKTQTIITTLPCYDNKRIGEIYAEQNWAYLDEDYQIYNDIIRRVGSKYNARINDMEKAYKDAGYENILIFDGIHLNLKGQALLAKHLLPYFIESLR